MWACVYTYRVIITQTPLVKRTGNFLLPFSHFHFEGALTHSQYGYCTMYIHKVYFCKHCNCRKSVTYQLPKPKLNCVVSIRSEYSVWMCINPQNFDVFHVTFFIVRRHRLLYSCLFGLLACHFLHSIIIFVFYPPLSRSLTCPLFLSPCRYSFLLFFCFDCAWCCCCWYFWIVCHDFTTSIKNDLVQQTNQSSFKGI